jgi:hypothetical protein
MFNDNDFEIQEAKLSGRSTDVDDDRLRELVEENDYSTTRVLAKELDVSAMSSCAMHRINLTYMFKLWLPHELTYADKVRSVRSSLICSNINARTTF